MLVASLSVYHAFSHTQNATFERYVNIPPVDQLEVPAFVVMLVVGCIQLACAGLMSVGNRRVQVNTWQSTRVNHASLISLPFACAQLLAAYVLLGAMMGIVGLHYLLEDPVNKYKAATALVGLLTLRISLG